MKRIQLLMILLILLPLGCSSPNPNGCVMVTTSYLNTFQIPLPRAIRGGTGATLEYVTTRPATVIDFTPTTRPDFGPTTRPTTRPATRPGSQPASGPTTTVAIVQEYKGSGVVVGKIKGAKGKPHTYYVLTARHLFPDGIFDVRVDGEEARIWAVSPLADVALLELKSKKKYKVRGFANAKVGQECWIYGYPGRHRGFEPFRYRVNICYVKGARIAWNGGIMVGLSGAPILDRWNRIVGMVTEAAYVNGIVYDSTGIGVTSLMIVNSF